MRITDPRFKYVDSNHTDIKHTLKRFGFKPTTDAERKARQERMQEPPPAATVTPITHIAKRRK